MPTNKKLKSKIEKEIIELYQEGLTQAQILKKLKSSDIKKKEIKRLIFESPYMTPKNFKYGSALALVIALVNPTFNIYLRGYEYHNAIEAIFVLSIIFALPFAIFVAIFSKTKNLLNLEKYSLVFLIYYAIYLVIFGLIAYDIKVWSIVLFPLILLPTFFLEYIKLQKLIKISGKLA